MSKYVFTTYNTEQFSDEQLYRLAVIERLEAIVAAIENLKEEENAK